MKRKSVIETDYREVEALVKKHLGFKNYSFPAVDECGNDSSHEFDVTGEPDDIDSDYLEDWKNGEFVRYSNGTLLNELARLGHIEKGEYIVSVCW